MLSVAKIQRRNAWRYYIRGVAFGDGRRPVGQSLKDAQELAGLPPGRWLGRGLSALGLTEGGQVSERQLELLFGEGRHPDADRIERGLLDDGVDAATARRRTVLGQPIEEIEARSQTPVLGMDFTFRPQASLVVLWALGDAATRRIIERAHERAIAKALRWLEDEVAETRWASGRGRAKTPALVVATFRHFDNRDGLPLLHEHCLILNRVQRRSDDGDPVWGALDTYRLYQNVVAAGTLYTLAMTTEVCENLGLATVPREVTPGLRPVMEVSGVPEDLINWSATRRQRIEDALEVLTDQYVKDHGHLPGERGRYALGWWAAQETRPAKKEPQPLAQLLVWWRAAAILHFGQQLIDGLLGRCRAVGAAIRARVDPAVDVALAAVDVAAVVFTVRENFSRRHVLAEARRHLLETLRGREYTRGLDDYIAHRALRRYSRRRTVTQPGRKDPTMDRITYTAGFPLPHRWWIAPAAGTPPRESSRYERARVASLAVQNAIRDARIRATTGEETAATVHAHQQAAMPEEHLQGRTTDAATWLRTPENLDRLAAFNREAEVRRRNIEDHARRPAHPTTPPGDAHRQEHGHHPHDAPGPAPGARP